MTEADIRKGMPSVKLSRQAFERRYKSLSVDAAIVPRQHEFDVIGAGPRQLREPGAGLSDPNPK